MRSLTTAAVLAALTLGGLVGAAAAADKISGQGSTFVKPMMDKWVQEYAKDHKDFEINYQATGSGAGIKAVIDMANDFGCSDAFLTKEQLDKATAAGGPVLHIPLVMGAVVPAYNLPGIKEALHFDGETLAAIFMGKVVKWNDPAIAALNKGVDLPDLPITPVHRSDGSGTTFVFCSFLALTSPEWKAERGAATAIDWKRVGSGENGNSAVAGAIATTEGAFGYIELTYALQHKAQFGAVKNEEGEFIVASTRSVTAAADGFLAAKKIPDDLRFNLADAPGKESYPISGTTWALVYVNQKGPPGKDLADFLTWVVTDGQKYCEDMHYAPLPEGLAKLAQEKLKTIK